ESGAQVHFCARRGEKLLSPTVTTSGPISANRSNTWSWTRRPTASITIGGYIEAASPAIATTSVPPSESATGAFFGDVEAANSAADPSRISEERIEAGTMGWVSIGGSAAPGPGVV